MTRQQAKTPTTAQSSFEDDSLIVARAREIDGTPVPWGEFVATVELRIHAGINPVPWQLATQIVSGLLTELHNEHPELLVRADVTRLRRSPEKPVDYRGSRSWASDPITVE